MDDLTRQIDMRFNQVDRRFDRVEQDIRDLRGDVNGLRTLTIRFGGSMIVGLAGVIAAVAANGFGS